MSRPNGSKNQSKEPTEITMSEAERLEFITNLLLEIADEELNEANDAAV